MFHYISEKHYDKLKRNLKDFLEKELGLICKHISLSQSLTELESYIVIEDFDNSGFTYKIRGNNDNCGIIRVQIKIWEHNTGKPISENISYKITSDKFPSYFDGTTNDFKGAATEAFTSFCNSLRQDIRDSLDITVWQKIRV